MDASFSVKNYRNRRCELVEMAGELDISTAPQLETVINRMLVVRHHILVDASRLTFIDSAGLKLLMRASQLVDGRIAIRGASYFHRRLLEMADISEFFCLEEDHEKAHRMMAELQAS